MESNTTRTSMETLTSPESSIRFNRHRRSRLKSETCRTLFRILSHCHDYSQSFPKSGDDINEVEKTNVEEVCVDLDGGDHVEDLVADEITNVNDVENGDGGSNRVQKIMGELEKIIYMEGNEEVAIENCSNVPTVSVEGNQTSNEAIEFVDNQENYFALEKILMEESENVEKLPVDIEHHSMSKDVEPCLDEVFEAGGYAENTPCEDKNETDEPEHQALQQNDIELIKSVCVIDKMGSPISDDVSEEIEEGEFFGEMGCCHQSSVELPALEEEKGIDKEQRSEDVMIKEMVNFNKLRQPDEQDAVSRHPNLDIADDTDNIMEYKASEEMDTLCTYKTDFSGIIIENKKASGFNRIPVNGSKTNQGDASVEALNCLKTYLGDIALHKDYSEENANNNGRIASAEKDADLSSKKKRSGTAEAKKKRNKKRKKKINDAGNNGAVKRCKIMPEQKPKEKKPCTHYLKGRCRKGDQCSFSHDGVPVTKSTPCVHFARHSCMKGDDCGFDHILSNYACENFVSTGSCHRGDACLFSHEIPGMNKPSVTSNVCKPENVDTKVYPCKNTNINLEETVLRPSAYYPKGSSSHSFTKKILDYSIKLKQGCSSPKENFKVEVQKRTPPAVIPKGMHLFSLKKSPSDNSTSMRQPVSSSNSDSGNVMSVLYHSSETRQTGSPLKAAYHICDQREQITLGNIQNARETPKKDSPVLVRPGTNPFSLSEARSDNSCINQQPSLAINKNNDFNLSVIHKQCVSEKSQCSDSPPGQSLGQLSTLASSARKALLSTLAFAARYESGIKLK